MISGLMSGFNAESIGSVVSRQLDPGGGGRGGGTNVKRETVSALTCRSVSHLVNHSVSHSDNQSAASTWVISTQWPCQT